LITKTIRKFYFVKTFTKKYNVNIIDYQSFSFSKAYDVKITNAIRLSSEYITTLKKKGQK